MITDFGDDGSVADGGTKVRYRKKNLVKKTQKLTQVETKNPKITPGKTAYPHAGGVTNSVIVIIIPQKIPGSGENNPR